MTRSMPAQDFNKIVKNRTEREILQEQYDTSYSHIRGQIEKVLMTTNIIMPQSVRDICNKLFTLEGEERNQFVIDNWGPLYADKTQLLFIRLDTLKKDFQKLIEQ